MTTRPPAPHLTLVTGPVRSGKSRHAEHLLAQHAVVTYVATGRPADAEDEAWARRVRDHQARRPVEWLTLETHDVAAALATINMPVLVDCLGTWLTATIDDIGWDDLDAATRRVRESGAHLVEALTRHRHPTVVVTNEVGWSLVPTTPSGRLFQDELGRLNAAVAATAATVHLVVAGRVLDLSSAPTVPLGPPPRTLRA